MPVSYMKHGRRHTSTGEDPIPGLGGTSLPAAIMLDGLTTRNCTGNLPMDFGSFWRNDTSFSYSDVTSGKAQYLTISTEGLYRAQFYLAWDTDWGAATYPYIEPACEIGGANANLVSTAAIYWDDTGGIIYGEQFTTAEMDHHEITATVIFDYTEAEFGENPLGIGLNMRSSGSRNGGFYGGMYITRIGDNMSAVTIT